MKRKSLPTTQLLVVLAFLAAPRPGAAQLQEVAFLQLADPPANYVDPAVQAPALSAVAARDDGLVFIGGQAEGIVWVVDARDPTDPSLACTVPVGVDTCALRLNPTGSRLWIGGDDADPDDDGLWYFDIPANPLDGSCDFTPVSVPNVESGMTPCFFAGLDLRDYVLISGRTCLDEALRILDVGVIPPVVVQTWAPANARTRLANAAVHRSSSDGLIAAVAGDFGGLFVLDVGGIPSTAPTVLAHFDWSVEPLEVDGCDRNGDGDRLECGEQLNGPPGRRVNAASVVAFAEVAGTTYLIVGDSSLGGFVQLFALPDVLASCPGELSCPDDVDCLNSFPVCPPSSAPDDCSANWPDIDRVAPVAVYRIASCPSRVNEVRVVGQTLLVAYAEEGLHVIDLAAAGLPPTAPATPLTLTAVGSFDTLPGNSDTILENYPCHPVGANDGCESSNTDWEPTPCQPSPPASARFRVVRNAGFGSATGAAFAGGHLWVSDQGSPDADGQPAPSHVGAPQGLWVIDIAASGWPEEVTELRIRRSGADPSALDLEWSPVPLATDYSSLRGPLPVVPPLAPACVARAPSTFDTLPGEVGGESRYYLVNARLSGREGSTGRDSGGGERPGPPLPCP